MATVCATMFVTSLVMTFCKVGVGGGGWREISNPNAFQLRALARFAYKNQKGPSAVGVTFLVTQARWKTTGGTMYNIGFIVSRGPTILEKCIVILTILPILGTGRRRVVNRFWCRPVP
ncbi:uncharacterized protein LOC119165795 isoform X1 [Rhipicephalus microplus]|uniref:uncharacterized protein LOC119165795 isoform X1 n=1 Tax=Rhipicephalus microplus TaxID=6941 RepID=UPI003F6BE77A